VRPASVEHDDAPYSEWRSHLFTVEPSYQLKFIAAGSQYPQDKAAIARAALVPMKVHRRKNTKLMKLWRPLQ
jgi:hypothetical protein